MLKKDTKDQVLSVFMLKKDMKDQVLSVFMLKKPAPFKLAKYDVLCRPCGALFYI